MYLRPSEIRFSQDSINNIFDKNSLHAYRRIGETLDALLKGQCNISDIPTIKVVNRNGVWFTVDNRRLWVFRKLEELGKCTDIPVRQDYNIPSRKLTTVNEGRSITVRRDAGGSYWKTYPRPSSVGTSTQSHHSTSFGARSMPTQFEFQGNRSIPVPSAIPSSFQRQFMGSDVTRNSPGYMQPAAGRFSSTGFASPIYSRTTAPSPSLASVELLDPADVRYTKESIKAPPFGSSYQFTNPILVYRAFDEQWALDGNRRLWSYKSARQYDPSLRVKATVKDDEEEFLEKMRADRPWLTLLDIVQMGETVTVE
ncbi:uncharacterized protein LOC110455953 [Mizuhopecten yessoensis]|uniref:uncharacterized protein LOC110455953 n=1 Tax=Mizuhopecten yessoensis TaxID=6573 RepID=UPI000B45A5FC|nr:uncharacterized protein LOC110455953 [Mizuhopecten yessoensis]